jgi:putative transposase
MPSRWTRWSGVPWSRFDLINAFNRWKNSEDAGRLFVVVAPSGTIGKQVSGLPWRREVSAQVVEEAAVDCGRPLAAFRDSRSGARKGPRVRFPNVTVGFPRLRPAQRAGG